MKTWTSAIALIAAGTMLVGSAFAQATSPSGDQKDKAESGGSPSASGPSSTDTNKSDSSTTKGDSSAAKPDMDSMKSAKHGKGGAMAHGSNAEQVRAVQQALKDTGHDPGDVDGKMGPRTQAALRDYQSKEGLKATGRLDAETMAKLGIEAKTGAAGASPSPSASPKTDTKADSKTDASSGAAASPKSDSSTSDSSSAPQSGASDTKSDTKK